MKSEPTEYYIIVVHTDSNSLPVKTEKHLILNEEIRKATINAYLSARGIGKVIFTGTKLIEIKGDLLPCSVWWTYNSTEIEKEVIDLVLGVIKEVSGKIPGRYEVRLNA
ncbi:MAG: hypothetical protein KAI57_01990 [Candidatus Pacebacteria bacterium]|nr:hypothetical protein [Candidatus Paceibacterota bacterium]